MLVDLIILMLADPNLIGVKLPLQPSKWWRLYNLDLYKEKFKEINSKRVLFTLNSITRISLLLSRPANHHRSFGFDLSR